MGFCGNGRGSDTRINNWLNQDRGKYVPRGTRFSLRRLNLAFGLDGKGGLGARSIYG